MLQDAKQLVDGLFADLRTWIEQGNDALDFEGATTLREMAVARADAAAAAAVSKALSLFGRSYAAVVFLTTAESENDARKKLYRHCGWSGEGAVPGHIKTPVSEGRKASVAIAKCIGKLIPVGKKGEVVKVSGATIEEWQRADFSNLTVGALLNFLRDDYPGMLAKCRRDSRFEGDATQYLEGLGYTVKKTARKASK